MCEFCGCTPSEPVSENEARDLRDQEQQDRVYDQIDDVAEGLQILVSDELELAYSNGYADGLRDGGRDALTLNSLNQLVGDVRDEPFYVYDDEDEGCGDLDCRYCYPQYPGEEQVETVTDEEALAALLDDLILQVDAVTQQVADLGILVADLRKPRAPF